MPRSTPQESLPHPTSAPRPRTIRSHNPGLNFSGILQFSLLRLRTKPRMLHSNKPVLQRPVEPGEYASQEFAKCCTENNVMQSMGGTVVCWANVVAESFFSSLKNEMFHHEVFPIRESPASRSRNTLKRPSTGNGPTPRRGITHLSGPGKNTPLPRPLRQHDHQICPKRLTHRCPHSGGS